MRRLLASLLLFVLAPAHAQDFGRALAAAARAQIGVTTIYDGAYAKLDYPDGDVPLARGVCTDVVIRAYRARGIDLQRLVHEDMARAFGAYPHAWGLAAPDSNIDHRRVPNLQAFFARNGRALAVSRDGADYAPGDLVTWRLPSGVPHIGIVSDASVEGRPLIVHNIGAGVRLEDMLFAFPITGRYRYAPGARP